VRCSVLQYDGVCWCSVTWLLQCVAVCCSVLQCVAVCCSACSVMQCVANVLQCVAACCSVHAYRELQCIRGVFFWCAYSTALTNI